MSSPANVVNTLTNQSSQANATTPANDQLTQSDFLQLMVTQMQNQDPTSPADPSQFLGQLAQMSEVSSLQNMQTTLSNLSTSLLSSQVVSGAGMVGHEVLASGTSGTLSSGGTLSGGVQAPSGATNLTVTVTDSSGQLVNSFAVAPVPGLTSFTWNGQTASGTSAPAGQYTIGVTATVSGVNQAVSPLIASKVQSVTIDPTTQTLDLNTDNGTVAMSNVVSVM